MLSINIFASLKSGGNTQGPADTGEMAGPQQNGAELAGTFGALWEKLGLPEGHSLDEQEMSALVNLLQAENGELLPADSTPDEKIISDELTGDDFLAFLMANAGDKIRKGELVITDEGLLSNSAVLEQANQADSTASGTETDAIIVSTDTTEAEDVSNISALGTTEFRLVQLEAQGALGEDAAEQGARLNNVGYIETLDFESDADLVSANKFEDEISEEVKSINLGVVDEDASIEPLTDDEFVQDKSIEKPVPIVELSTARIKVGEVAQTTPSKEEIEGALKMLKEAKQPLETNASEDEGVDVETLTAPKNSNKASAESSVQLMAAEKVAVSSEKVSQNQIELNAKLPEADLDKSNLTSLELNAPKLNSGTKVLADQVNQLMTEQSQRPVRLTEAGQALVDRIQTMVTGDIKQAFIRLDPPELGALEIKIQVQNDQTQVQIISQSSQVRDALEQHSARLRDALINQGLDLSNLDVSDNQTQSHSGGHSSGEHGSSGDMEEGELDQSVDVKTQNLGLVDQYV